MARGKALLHWLHWLALVALGVIIWNVFSALFHQ